MTRNENHGSRSNGGRTSDRSVSCLFLRPHLIQGSRGTVWMRELRFSQLFVIIVINKLHLWDPRGKDEGWNSLFRWSCVVAMTVRVGGRVECLKEPRRRATPALNTYSY